MMDMEASRLAYFLRETTEKIADGGYEFYTLNLEEQVRQITTWFADNQITQTEAENTLSIIKEERFAQSAA